jgi:hypothetical protein
MSDDGETQEEAAPLPTAQVLARDKEGDYIGLMHLSDTVRSFIAPTMDRVRKVMVDLGLNEFGLDQPAAESVADAAVQSHVDEAEASAAHEPVPDVEAEEPAESAESPLVGLGDDDPPLVAASPPLVPAPLEGAREADAAAPDDDAAAGGVVTDVVPDTDEDAEEGAVPKGTKPEEE